MSAIVIAIIIVALLVGGLGLLIEGLFWLLVISVVLLAVGAFMAMTGRKSARA